MTTVTKVKKARKNQILMSVDDKKTFGLQMNRLLKKTTKVELDYLKKQGVI